MEQDHDREGTSGLRPLTKRGADGSLYTRPPEVERQIAAAVALAPAELLARLEVADRASPAYLREECLVYLLRTYRQTNQPALIDALATTLLRRSVDILKHTLGGLSAASFEEASDVCIQDMFERILDVETNRGDFYQARYRMGLKRLAITAFNRFQALDEHGRHAASLDEESDDDAPHGPIQLEAGGLTTEQHAQMTEALARIDEPYRTAFVLRYFHNWPTEDDDPSVPTISSYYNKTPRTIRNWLTRAESALAQWRGENQ